MARSDVRGDREAAYLALLSCMLTTRVELRSKLTAKVGRALALTPRFSCPQFGACPASRAPSVERAQFRRQCHVFGCGTVPAVMGLRESCSRAATVRRGRGPRSRAGHSARMFDDVGGVADHAGRMGFCRGGFALSPHHPSSCSWRAFDAADVANSRLTMSLEPHARRRAGRSSGPGETVHRRERSNERAAQPQWLWSASTPDLCA